MDSFAFIIHPINPKRDVARKYPLLGKALSEGQINFFSRFFPPVYLSEITGVTSVATGKEIKGWFLACPYTPQRMLQLPRHVVYNKIIQTGRMAERLGAKTLGLGAFTSVVGDAGITVAHALDIPVTNGDAYTVVVAVRSIEKAAQEMGIPIGSATAAVVGATGAIGRVCADMLAGVVGELYLIGKHQQPLDALAERIKDSHPNAILHTTTNIEALRKSKLILTVTSSLHAIIQPGHLQPGSVICDVARPRDVSAMVAASRNDVLVIDGGMVSVPGSVDFNFDFGFPSGMAYACMVETMALALEGRFEDYSLGKQINPAQVMEIGALADKHGFRLTGFRSFEREVSRDQIERVRQRSQPAHIYV